jgi:hypothetical protein
MQWNRSETIALALACCAHCGGYGLRPAGRGLEQPCNCVFRAIFRACYRRFRQCADGERHLSRVSLEFCRGKEGRMLYSRTTENYIADFCLVSRRCLDDADYRLFRFHFLLGADWTLCCRRLGMNRGTFFHSVYRIEHRLGRIFRELRPYPLYPLDEYFSGVCRPAEPQPRASFAASA